MRLLLVAALAVAVGPNATFVDPTGDAVGGDISAVRVQATRDAVRFSVAISPDADSLRIWFDTDADARTGDDGFEVRLTVVNVNGDVESSFERWAGSVGVWIDSPTPAPVRAALGSSFVIEVPRIDFGYPATFRFALLGGGYGPNLERAFDRAPDVGGWRFTARSHRIALDHGIGGVAIGMHRDDVRRILGTPERVSVRGRTLTERYVWQRMTVTYRGGSVAAVSTTNGADHTARNVGVASPAASVQRLVPAVRCSPRACVRRTQRASTAFALAGGRVTRITVAAQP